MKLNNYKNKLNAILNYLEMFMTIRSISFLFNQSLVFNLTPLII